MSFFIDQCGRTVNLAGIPSRIISLVPSQTELLADLGLDESVCGITKFCIHPEKWFHGKTRVGGTKTIQMDIIHRLQPDLVIANKEENTREQVEMIAADYPVWVSDIHCLDDALQMIRDIGSITGSSIRSNTIATQIEKNFADLSMDIGKDNARPTAAYLVWQNPYMTAGGDTFINSMMEACGFENMFKHSSRYPETTMEELRAIGCQYIVLSSEPFPFTEKHATALQAQCPGMRIILADGEMFSWYGSRLLKSPGYFRELVSAEGISR